MKETNEYFSTGDVKHRIKERTVEEQNIDNRHTQTMSLMWIFGITVFLLMIFVMIRYGKCACGG